MIIVTQAEEHKSEHGGGGRALLVMHQAHSTPGKVGLALHARGYTLEECRPQQGEPLPRSAESHDVIVMFGGPQSAYWPEMKPEIDWLEKVVLASTTPALGICLGAQAMALALGAEVRRCDEGRIELGYYEVAPVPGAEDFLDAPTVFYQWHSDTFEIPSGARHLARSEACEGQAFRHGNAVGIEFHPEMTEEMVHKWCTSERGAPKLQWPNAQPAEAHRAGYPRYAAASDAWLSRFLDGFLPA